MILDLCGGTGSWSKPYIEAGYKVRIVDLLTTGEDVRLLNYPRTPVHGILAAPPCTEFARAGARHWKVKGEAALLTGLSVVDACIRIIMALRPTWWALENPEGRLTRFLGAPAYKFSPHEFGANYSKQTLLWGKFNPPVKLENPPKPSRKACEHDSPSPDRQLRRSMTYSGFAQAFFEVNP